MSRLTAAFKRRIEKEGTRRDVSHCEFVDVPIMQITVMHHVVCLGGLVGDVVVELVANAFRKVGKRVRGAGREQEKQRRDVNPVTVHRKVRK